MSSGFVTSAGARTSPIAPPNGFATAESMMTVVRSWNHRSAKVGGTIWKMDWAIPMQVEPRKRKAYAVPVPTDAVPA